MRTGKKARGIEIQSVGIASISYDEESQKLINMRNQGAMMGDPNIREGFVQSSIAKGLEGSRFQRQRSHGRLYGNGYGYAGSRRLHERGQQYEHAADAAAGPVPADDEPAAGSADAAGRSTVSPRAANSRQATPGPVPAEQSIPETSARTAEAAVRAPAAWTCTCGAVNTGKFCPNCGKPRP